MTDVERRLRAALEEARYWIYREEAPDFARNFETLDHVRDGEGKDLLRRIDAALKGSPSGQVSTGTPPAPNLYVTVSGAGHGYHPGRGAGGGGGQS